MLMATDHFIYYGNCYYLKMEKYIIIYWCQAREWERA